LIFCSWRYFFPGRSPWQDAEKCRPSVFTAFEYQDANSGIWILRQVGKILQKYWGQANSWLISERRDVTAQLRMGHEQDCPIFNPYFWLGWSAPHKKGNG